MGIKRTSIICAGLTAALLSGCSASSENYASDVAVGSVGGGALGAGTGAIVGSMITDGVIGSSAVLGAGIGIPVGAALGVLYSTYSVDRQLDRNEDLIQGNQRRYLETQQEIDALREQQLLDSKSIELDENLGEHQYLGNTTGNPYR